MRYTNRIGEAQLKFLREVRDGISLEVAKTNANADEKRLARWMRNKFFRINFRKGQKEASRLAKSVLRAAADVARRELAEDLKKPPEERMSSEERAMRRELIEDSREDDRLEYAGRRPRKKKVRVDPERDLVHPNFKHLEAEMLAVLEGGAC